jgi:hypothetical protein
MLNTDAIAERFAEVGWVKGVSKGSIRNIVSDILEEVERELDRQRNGFLQFLERHDFQEPNQSGLRSWAKSLLEDFVVPELLGDNSAIELESRLAGIISRVVDEAISPQISALRTGSESPTDSLTVSAFMKFICGYNTLQERAKARDTQVRAYELFLFAFQQGIKKEVLTMPRSKLSSDFIPNEKYDSSLSILVNHGGAAQDLEEWDREDQERQRVIDELEEKTEKDLVSGEIMRASAKTPLKKVSTAKMATKKKSEKKYVR